jgi:hypothetical protein
MIVPNFLGFQGAQTYPRALDEATAKPVRRPADAIVAG